MNHRSRIFLSLTLLLFTAPGYAAPAILALSNAENSALRYSPRLKGIASEQQAYEERAAAQKTRFYPRLTLDGSYRYVTHVQEIMLPFPGSSPLRFGDNSNYSLGPSLSWTAWDFGGIENTWKSLSAAAEAKKNEAAATGKQILLAVRSAYFQVALAGEQVTLYTDALKLANAQYDDIRINVRAGTKSLSDELKSHQEVIARKKQLRQAQADRDSALRDLSAITGKEHAGMELENIDTLLEEFARFATAAINENHPALLVFRKSAESAEYARQAAGAQKWPGIRLTAKSSLEYPDGAVRESYNQNAIGAVVSWPLYESGATKKRMNENENMKQASLQRGEQALADMKRDRDKTASQLANLQEQKALNDISVKETGQLAQILYKAYATGSLSYLEVETANFRALEAKIQAAKTKVQILMNLALLASMEE